MTPARFSTEIPAAHDRPVLIKPYGSVVVDGSLGYGSYGGRGRVDLGHEICAPGCLRLTAAWKPPGGNAPRHYLSCNERKPTRPLGSENEI